MAVDLRILPQSLASRLGSSREQLGFALPSARAGSASATWVFYRRVEELAEGKNASKSQILGHAIAHEIGHLLLGPDRHSDRGIMRANWGRRDLQEAARGQLFFTIEQGERIRTEVCARMDQSAAPQVAASGALR
jgi:predicted transcriptional regulator